MSGYLYILFFISSSIIVIINLNMLIAIMGDTFERVTEMREQSAAVEKAVDQIFDQSNMINEVLDGVRAIVCDQVAAAMPHMPPLPHGP